VEPNFDRLLRLSQELNARSLEILRRTIRSSTNITQPLVEVEWLCMAGGVGVGGKLDARKES